MSTLFHILFLAKLILKIGYNLNLDVFNEGRAAEVQFSAIDSDAPESDTSLLPELARLAVCVGYEYAKVWALPNKYPKVWALPKWICYIISIT